MPMSPPPGGARGHLPGLSAQLRRRQRRRHRRPRRHPRAPAATCATSASTRIWLSPWYPSPMADARLRRRRLPRHRPDLRHPRRGRGADRRGPRARHPGHHRHRPEPQLRPARLVPGGARGGARLGRSASGTSSVPAGASTASCRPTTGSPSSAARPGPGSEPTARQWYLHLFAPEQPDLNWEHPEVRRGVRGHPAVLVRPRRRRLPHRRRPTAWSRTPACPTSAARPRPPADHAVLGPRRGPRRSTARWRAIADALRGRPRLRRRGWHARPRARSPATCAPTSCTPAFNFDFLSCAVGRRASCARSIDATARRARARSARPPPGCCPTTTSTRHVTRYGRADTGFDMRAASATAPDRPRRSAPRRARAAALLMLALPGSASTSTRARSSACPRSRTCPTTACQDPICERSGHTDRGRDGCRVPLPWSGDAPPSASPRRRRDRPGCPSPPHWSDPPSRRRRATRLDAVSCTAPPWACGAPI